MNRWNDHERVRQRWNILFLCVMEDRWYKAALVGNFVLEYTHLNLKHSGYGASNCTNWHTVDFRQTKTSVSKVKSDAVCSLLTPCYRILWHWSVVTSYSHLWLPMCSFNLTCSCCEDQPTCESLQTTCCTEEVKLYWALPFIWEHLISQQSTYISWHDRWIHVSCF